MMIELLLLCDDCRTRIDNPEKAEVAFGWNDDHGEKPLVVHKPYACPRWRHRLDNLPSNVRKRGSFELCCYLGSLGLCEIVADIERGDLTTEAGLVMIRRLHVTGFEQYRKKRQEAIDAGAG